MAKYLYRLVMTLFVINLYGCATQFNESNTEKLRIGMLANEVREIFGSPDQISSAVCGGSTTGGQWICETWKYDTFSGRNDFTFSVKQEGKFLNNWNVKSKNRSLIN